MPETNLALVRNQERLRRETLMATRGFKLMTCCESAVTHLYANYCVFRKRIGWNPLKISYIFARFVDAIIQFVDSAEPVRQLRDNYVMVKSQ